MTDVDNADNATEFALEAASVPINRPSLKSREEQEIPDSRLTTMTISQRFYIVLLHFRFIAARYSRVPRGYPREASYLKYISTTHAATRDFPRLPVCPFHVGPLGKLERGKTKRRKTPALRPRPLEEGVTAGTAVVTAVTTGKALGVSAEGCFSLTARARFFHLFMHRWIAGHNGKRAMARADGGDGGWGGVEGCGYGEEKREGKCESSARHNRRNVSRSLAFLPRCLPLTSTNTNFVSFHSLSLSLSTRRRSLL